MELLVVVVLGYVVGSLPFAYLLASGLRGIDLRRVGSGNVGAANVHRSAGLPLAILVVGLDVAKGAGSVILASRFDSGPVAPVAAGLAAVAGHVYPIWLRFRGGKGVATACGVFATLAPVATAIAACVFVLIVAVSRYVSLGSMVAAAALPPLAWLTNAPMPVTAGSIATGVLILARHRANASRLHQGLEPRLGERV